jgi:multiple sugar transport system substrate-binding protein
VVDEVREEFEAATGATLTVTSVPLEGAFNALMDDAASGARSYDGAMISMQWLGELVEGSLVVPLGAYWADGSGKYPTFDLESEPEALKRLRFFGGEMFAAPIDCDGQVLYYRRDLLTDQHHAKAFADEYGYALPVPPRTWEQLRDVARYFNGKPNGIDGSPVSGMALALEVGGQGMYHYASLSAPHVIGPENPDLWWFDPDTMDPLVASQGHVRAASMLKELYGLGPEAMAGWSLDEALDSFLTGSAVFTFSGGGVTTRAMAQKQPTVGKLGCAQLPGTVAYVNPSTGEEFPAAEPNIVGNTTGDSWSGVVLTGSANPDLTYYLWALLATEPKERYYAARGADGVDPGRSYQMPRPVGSGSIDDYIAQGWDAKDAEEYTRAYFDTFTNPLQLPYLRIPGSGRYWSALDIRLSQFWTGQLASAEEALAKVVADFDEITDGLDRDRQRQSYRTSLDIE